MPSLNLTSSVRALVPFDVPRLADAAITTPLGIAALGAGIVVGAVIGVAGYPLVLVAGILAMMNRACSSSWS